MKFRTEIAITPWQHKIEYSHNIVSFGSCFAQNIASEFARRKFRITATPTGILFNPASIAESMVRIAECRTVSDDDIFFGDGRWLSYDFHSSFAGSSHDEARYIMQRAVNKAHNALRTADHVILSLGTAWVYRLTESGKIVANCHKQPHVLFRREKLGVEEVVRELQRTIDVIRPEAHIILTLSPVRHIGEGAEDNSLSKATLRVAIAEIVERNPRVTYFPSYEIMMDDLRDYRFYADDLVHPNAMAVEYIAEKFFDAALSDQAKRLAPQVEQVVRAAQHRPQNPSSEQHLAFCRRQLATIAGLKDVDFEEEKSYFEKMLQINL